jgi:hypothetical protein
MSQRQNHKRNPLPHPPKRMVIQAVAVIFWTTIINASPQKAFDDAKIQKQQRHDVGKHGGIYEDAEVRILIPRDWRILKVGSPDDPLSAHPPAVPQTFIPTPGRGLLLSSKGFTLTLAFTGHGSPIIGGRFTEIFHIPWLEEVSAAGTCAGYLRKRPQPVSRTLLFVNMAFEFLDSEAREKCEIPKDVLWDPHWFGGYFTTARGGYFFESDGPECMEKAYTLTSAAKTPLELPHADDPSLQKIIGEAIDIVASIHYKRCPPTKEFAGGRGVK